ncbi:MAG: hypothetical protein AVDCRST_MAG87-895 [uncultured Thermomicrobiales bacterium]|uniref:Uncharacterized protein n=1 Tax=uncultured Thermomicrobiales bacterium TaxID=1645740 RepID=A0A6J4UML1_9BACT|nr:MAG: hypothetical protein AVDCRST_MAG87-895 [uncultured Thermomicrobiales bacterium]
MLVIPWSRWAAERRRCRATVPPAGVWAAPVPEASCSVRRSPGSDGAVKRRRYSQPQKRETPGALSTGCFPFSIAAEEYQRDRDRKVWLRRGRM